MTCFWSADRPVTNSASHWSALYNSAALRATSAASNLALYDQQSKRADVPIKHPDLKTSTSPVTKLTTVWSDSYYKEGIAGGRNFNDGNEEDCYYTYVHEKDKFVCYLNDGQGVYETPGAYQEASTTNRWQEVWSKFEFKAKLHPR